MKKIIREIMKEEGLESWELKLIEGDDGICLDKKLVIGKKGFPYLALHEIAHALTTRDKTDMGDSHCRCGHGGLFVDKFHYLCNKYHRKLVDWELKQV